MAKGGNGKGGGHGMGGMGGGQGGMGGGQGMGRGSGGAEERSGMGSGGPAWKPDKDSVSGNYGEAVSDAARSKPSGGREQDEDVDSPGNRDMNQARTREGA